MLYTNYTIYKHTCIVNNKSYIGLTQNIIQRTLYHKRSKSAGCTAFHNAIVKYGWESFVTTILAQCPTLEEANRLEIQFIAEHHTQTPNGYNIKAGGDAGGTYVMSDTHRYNISVAKQGSRHTQDTIQLLKQIKSTQEYKDRVKTTRSSKEFKDKMANLYKSKQYQQNIAYRQTPEYKEQCRQRRLGIPHTQDRINNIKKSLALRKHIPKLPNSPEFYAARSAAMKGVPKPKHTCSICGISTSLTNIKRWHENNCKHRS